MRVKVLFVNALICLILPKEATSARKNVTRQTVQCSQQDLLNNPDARQKVSMKKITCSADPNIIDEINCRLVPGNRTHKRLTIAIHSINDVSVVSLRLIHWVKTNNNVYRHGFFDVMLDICDLAKKINTDEPSFAKFFLDTTIPKWRNEYGHLLHPCPYNGWLIFNQTITGLPCGIMFNSGDTSGYLGSKWESKLELIYYFGSKEKHGMIITLFDSNY